MSLEQAKDNLTKLLINPPSREGALEMCQHMEQVYISAISGLLTNCITDQSSLDESYKLVLDASNNLKDTLHQVLYIIATKRKLKPQGELTDVNLQTYYDILGELDNAD